MSFDLGGVVIRVDAAKAALAETRAGLQQTQDAADDAAATMGKLGEAAGKAAQDVAFGMKTAAGTVGATGETFSDFFDRLDRDQKRVLEQIQGPWARYQADLKATNALFDAGTISMGQFEGASGRLADRLEALQRRDLSPQLRLEVDLLEQITGPLKRYEQELAALNSLLSADQISLEQYDAALAKVQKRAQAGGAIAPTQGPVFKQELAGLAAGPMLGPAFDVNQAGRGMSEELKREEELLRRLQAPMKQYELDLATLDSLLKKDQIDLETYNREMERAQKAAGRGLGPVLGPKQQTGLPSLGGDDHDGGHGRGTELIESVAPRFGAVGDILGGLATKGTIATAAVVALGVELVHLGDEYIVLSNKARKVTEAGGSIDETLQQQLALSKELHGSLDATLELYDAVRDGTDELNLSQKQQVDLAREIGQAVVAEGKSIESAEGLMRRLTYAFASGAITGRDLRSIMKEFPDIGAAFVTTMGHSRTELIAMANKGQISAEILIDSFRKMNHEMAEKVDKQVQTSTQHWQHFKDTLTIDLPNAIRGFSDAIAASEGMDIDIEGIERAERAARALREKAEATRLLTGEQERNAKTAALASVAGKLGIDFAFFDEAHANKVAELRIQMSHLGIETEDVFQAAHAKASLFGRKLEEIQERKDAEKIAEDVKRIWDAMHGADDALDAQAKHWHDIADQARIAAEAAAKFRANQPVGPMDAQHAQMQRDLDLAAKNTQTGVDDAQYGAKMVTYAQGINSARAELEALNRAARDGKIQGDAYTKQYEALMTTLNDGRLPEVIKIWDSVHNPIAQAERDLRAVGVLWRQGRLDIEQYTTELKKIADTHINGYASILAEDIAVLDKRFADGQLGLRTYDEAVQKLTKSFDELHRTSRGIAYRIAPNLTPSGGNQSVGEAARTTLGQSSLDFSGLVPQTSDMAKLRNDEFERANALMEEFVGPSIKYEQRLGDITRALNLNGITEDQATAARRRARTEYNQQLEALEATKGPLEAYQAAIKKLGDQLAAGDISAKQYGDGIDKARVAMLQATGAAEDLQGALEIEWIKMKGEADQFGASLAKMAVDDLGKFTDAIVTAANGGQVSFGQMANSMIQDLERIALKMLEVKAITAIVGLFGGGGLTTVGVGNAGTMNTDLLQGLGVEGYANGGSYVVGGSGGVDSQLQMFRATPGERVTITPPGAYPYAPASAPSAGSSASGGGTPVIHVHNHYDSDVVTAGITSGAGQTAVLNVLRANAPAIRGALGIR